jgi:NAD(P)-dependent dehydrogenase (short-subunit alcohol dehydrogenase family)
VVTGASRGIGFGIAERLVADGAKVPQAVQECHDQLVNLAADGVIKPLVSERLQLAAVGDGLQRLADGTTVGRVVYVA